MYVPAYMSEYKCTYVNVYMYMNRYHIMYIYIYIKINFSLHCQRVKAQRWNYVLITSFYLLSTHLLVHGGQILLLPAQYPIPYF